MIAETVYRAHSWRMIGPGRLPEIWQRLSARAAQLPPPESVFVMVGGVRIGVTSPAVAQFLTGITGIPHFLLHHQTLVLDERALKISERSSILRTAALRLRDAGFVRGWRNEELDVRAAPDAPVLATIERAACRTLGITTTSAHLNAFTVNDEVFIAQRSPAKQIDPGSWDNLVGGMVAAGESALTTLQREAHEEADLDLSQLIIRQGGCVQVRRPVREGYQSEFIYVFDSSIASDVHLSNRDNEVAAFDRRPVDAVLDAIEREEFTLESSLATVEGLARRKQIQLPSSPYLKALVLDCGN